jgi:hypothetical protein
MNKQLLIAVGTIIALVAMITPALAQGACGVPVGCGFGGPAGFGIGGPGPCGIGGLGGFGGPVGCGIGAPLGGFGGCGFGAPLGIGGCGFASPLTGLVSLGLAMIESVMGAAFSCIPGVGFGGFGLGGCGIPFGGFC